MKDARPGRSSLKKYRYKGTCCAAGKSTRKPRKRYQEPPSGKQTKDESFRRTDFHFPLFQISSWWQQFVTAYSDEFFSLQALTVWTGYLRNRHLLPFSLAFSPPSGISISYLILVPLDTNRRISWT